MHYCILYIDTITIVVELYEYYLLWVNPIVLLNMFNRMLLIVSHVNNSVDVILDKLFHYICMLPLLKDVN